MVRSVLLHVRIAMKAPDTVHSLLPFLTVSSCPDLCQPTSYQLLQQYPIEQ